MPSQDRPPRNGERGYFPDHDAERRDAFKRTTPGQRVAEAIEISRVATRLAVVGQQQRER